MQPGARGEHASRGAVHTDGYGRACCNQVCTSKELALGGDGFVTGRPTCTLSIPSATGQLAGPSSMPTTSWLPPSAAATTTAAAPGAPVPAGASNSVRSAAGVCTPPGRPSACRDGLLRAPMPARAAAVIAPADRRRRRATCADTAAAFRAATDARRRIAARGAERGEGGRGGCAAGKLGSGAAGADQRRHAAWRGPAAVHAAAAAAAAAAALLPAGALDAPPAAAGEADALSSALNMRARFCLGPAAAAAGGLAAAAAAEGRLPGLAPAARLTERVLPAGGVGRPAAPGPSCAVGVLRSPGRGASGVRRAGNENSGRGGRSVGGKRRGRG
jgi:hypothetical protein